MTNHKLDVIGGGMDYSFDADVLLSTGFTLLDEAFGAYTSVSALTVTVPTFKVKKDEEGRLEGAKVHEDEEGNSNWEDANEEVSKGKWRIELTEVQVEKTASEGLHTFCISCGPVFLAFAAHPLRSLRGALK